MNWSVRWDWGDVAPPDDPDWRKERKWGGAYQYVRKYGTALWVTDNQNTLLDAIARSAKATQDGVATKLRENRIGKKWDDRVVMSALEDVRREILEAGWIGSGFVAADRIAVKTAQRCRARHKRILPPVAYEANPTFRIAAGRTHEAPVEVERVEGVRDRVTLGDMGFMYCEGRADDAWGDCAYAEMTRMAGCWHVRFIWLTEKRSSNDTVL